MSKKKAKTIGLGCLHRYARSVLGYSHQHGISVYESVSLALEAKGYPRGHLDAKAHVGAFAHIVKGTPKTSHISASKMAKQSKVVSDAFLASYEWRQLRMQAIKKYGARCQCCGSTPADGITINVDHIKPRKLFPNLAMSLNNLQILCNVCNHGKGNWDMTDWRRADAEDGSEDIFLSALDKRK